MKANELRVGNLVNYKGKILTVKIIEKCSDGDMCFFENDYSFIRCGDLSPIALTPELLERCGFVGNPNTMTGSSLEIKDHEKVFKSISIYYNNDTAENQYYLFMREGAKDEPRTNDGVVLLMRNLQYLHQLQNLFFVITGNELEVKM